MQNLLGSEGDLEMGGWPIGISILTRELVLKNRAPTRVQCIAPRSSILTRSVTLCKWEGEVACSIGSLVGVRILERHVDPFVIFIVHFMDYGTKGDYFLEGK